MMDLAKFERVFAKAPESRPVSNTGRYHLVHWREGDRGWWGWQCKLPDFKDDPPLGEDVVDSSCAAALIRDAVVWWLRERGWTFWKDITGVGGWKDNSRQFEVAKYVPGAIDQVAFTEVLYVSSCKELGIEP